MKVNRWCICSYKRAEDWHTDNVILGQCHNDDWVDFDIDNEYLYNYFLSRTHAENYIKQHDLDDCEIIEIEFEF